MAKYLGEVSMVECQEPLVSKFVHLPISGTFRFCFLLLHTTRTWIVLCMLLSSLVSFLFMAFGLLLISRSSGREYGALCIAILMALPFIQLYHWPWPPYLSM